MLTSSFLSYAMASPSEISKMRAHTGFMCVLIDLPKHLLKKQMSTPNRLYNIAKKYVNENQILPPWDSCKHMQFVLVFFMLLIFHSPLIWRMVSFPGDLFHSSKGWISLSQYELDYQSPCVDFLASLGCS